MLNRTSRYALRTLGFLVEHRRRRMRGKEIAEATGIPANYLSKILNRLRKEGIVDSEKGWGGGFTVRETALTLRIQRILEIFEGTDLARRRECAFGLTACDASNPCPLHGAWERIQDELDRMTTSISIQDLGTA